ncbi:aldolase/citrate lyase family protein, partial [Rhizobium leguminosarum]|uniref:aldolase/citrate lyase family protein n=1 Tax=Rhizobium leguminosarum TaxID=384 RepID=UPI003F97364C
VGGAAIIRPHSHERPIIIRYLNSGADGIMVPMVDTAEQARAVRKDDLRGHAHIFEAPASVLAVDEDGIGAEFHQPGRQ